MITIDDAIEYREHRLEAFEAMKHPRAQQRARRERRLLEALLSLRQMGTGR